MCYYFLICQVLQILLLTLLVWLKVSGKHHSWWGTGKSQYPQLSLKKSPFSNIFNLLGNLSLFSYSIEMWDKLKAEKPGSQSLVLYCTDGLILWYCSWKLKLHKQHMQVMITIICHWPKIYKAIYKTYITLFSIYTNLSKKVWLFCFTDEEIEGADWLEIFPGSHD